MTAAVLVFMPTTVTPRGDGRPPIVRSILTIRSWSQSASRLCPKLDTKPPLCAELVETTRDTVFSWEAKRRMPDAHLRALTLDTLVNQVCSLLERRPKELTQREIHTLETAHQTMRNAIVGLWFSQGKDLHEAGPLTRDAIFLMGFVHRAEEDLRAIAFPRSLSMLFGDVSRLLHDAFHLASLDEIPPEASAEIISVFMALREPAREDLKRAPRARC
jgi:hypothetical protein